MSYLYPHHTLVGYVLIKKIRILNANAISSPLTYGFPAISGFIGSVHALSRKISQQDGLENVRLEAEARSNLSKIICWSSLDIPIPLSFTRIFTPFSTL